MKNIFSKTTENRTQNGVKSYSFPTRLLSPILIFTFLTLGVGQMWGAVTLYYQKDMPANNYSASNSATMTQSSVNSDRYYCTLNLTASSSYGFYIKWDNNYYKVSATAQNYTDVLLYDYGSTNYGNSPHRVTYTTPSSGGNTIFIFDTSNKKICVSPTSSQTIKISYATASGKDSYYDLGNYTDLSQDGSSANYYVDLDLTAVKYYMFMQLKVGSSTYSYWRGTSTLTEGNSVSLYDYGTSNYGNSSDKVNFTPSAAGKYRFTWNQLDKTVKLQRVYKVTYDGNGSTSGTTPDDAYYPNGATVMVASNSGSLAKTGYTFDGWNTANDGSGTSYDAGANITVTDSDVKLYAKWAQQSLTITSYPTYLSETDKLTLGIDYANIPSGYCYRVKVGGGYYNNSSNKDRDAISGSGSTTFTSFSALPITENTVVVELWKDNPFKQQTVASGSVTVTVEQSYNINVQAKTDGVESTKGGTVSPASVSPTAHKGQTITASEPNTGYKFTGWTANTANITFENASERSTTVYATASGTVYANYVRQSGSYSTTFYAGDHGSINAKGIAIAKNGNASVTIGENETLSATPESAEYVFDHWETTGSVSVADIYSANTTVTATDAGGTVTAYYRHRPELGAVIATPSGTQNYAGSPIDITMSVTSTYLPNPVVIFYVTDNSNSTTYEVVATTGAIGSSPNYETTHTATFSASNAATYSVTAKVFAGELIDNFVTNNKTYWYNLNGGSATRIHNDLTKRTASNGSSDYLKITCNTNNWHTAYTCNTADNTEGATSWGKNYNYFYISMYAPQAESSTKVKYRDHTEAAGSALSANTWQRIKFTRTEGNIDYIMPFVESAGNNSIYIDDIILSNEETMTEKATAAEPASFSINWNYTVTLNNNDATTPGTESVNVTYGSALSNIAVPSKTDYTFYGYYTENAGEGRQLIDAAGVWIASVDGYTDENKNWVHGDDITLYAKWGKNPSLTGLELSTSVVTTGNTFTATPTIDAGDGRTTNVCWAVKNNSDEEVSTKITPIGGNAVTITAPAAPGNYKVVATLREGNDCGGTVLNSLPQSFTVEGRYSVTITNGVGSSFVGEETTATVTANPAAEGKKFDHWTVEGTYTLQGGTSLTSREIQFTASTNISITAVYTERDSKTVYFARPSGWTDGLKVYAWEEATKDGGNPSNKNANWPGVECTSTTTEKGTTYYYYTYYTDDNGEGDDKRAQDRWDKIIFNDNGNDSEKTKDLTLVNGHFYHIADGDGGNGRNTATVSGSTSAEDWYVCGYWNQSTDDWGFAHPVDLNGAKSGSVVVTVTASRTQEFKIYRASTNEWFKWTGGPNADYYDNYAALIGGPMTLRIYNANRNTFTSYATEYRFTLDITSPSNPVLTLTPNDNTPYSATLSKNGNGSLSVGTGAITLHQYIPTTITATPEPGYRFTGWTTTGSVAFADGTSSSNATASFTATDNGGTITANFSNSEVIYFDASGVSDRWGDEVYVTFFSHDFEWNNGNGALIVKNWVDNALYCVEMTRIPNTDIYYLDYSNLSGHERVTQYVLFTSKHFVHGGENNYYQLFEMAAVTRGDYVKSSTNNLFVAEDWREKDKNKTGYYVGYWMNYKQTDPGVYLDIHDGGSLLPDIPNFQLIDGSENEYTATYTLSGNNTYKLGLRGANGTYYNNDRSGTMTFSNCTGWSYVDRQKTPGGISTTADGEYKFTLTCGDKLTLSVEYPLSVGDYRIIYQGALEDTTSAPRHDHPSKIIRQLSGGATERKDTVSFFVTGDWSITLQKCTSVTPNITWEDACGSATKDAEALGLSGKTGVYVFPLTLSSTGGDCDRITVGTPELYTGDYYIRTDVAKGGWEGYTRSLDNRMTYSDYAKHNSGFDYYNCQYAQTNKNVKFTIANDYSFCITDTLEGDAYVPKAGANIGKLPYQANIRFMYNSAKNTISRAYLNGSSETGENTFLYLQSTSNASEPDIYQSDGSELVDNTIRFNDHNNWIYQIDIQANEQARVKLISNYRFNSTDHLQYFKGTDGDWSEATTSEIIGGDYSSHPNERHALRIIYDFKTNHLLSAWLVPESGSVPAAAINTNVMIIKQNQEDARQITFSSGNDALTEVDTVYTAVLLTKDFLTGGVASEYAKQFYWVSFPYTVQINDIFGSVGTYGYDWILQRYNGKKRAANGFWIDSEPNWEFMDKSETLNPYEGYILTLDLSEFTTASNKWGNSVTTLSLYFPSDSKVGNIKQKDVTVEYDQTGYACTITRDNRNIKDSYWRCIGSPSFAENTIGGWNRHENTDDTWKTENLPFLYEWNSATNQLSPVAAGGNYTFKPLTGYMVQYSGASLNWTNVVTPSVSAPKRQNSAATDLTYKLQLVRGEEEVDHTFVRFSDDENITAAFEFNQDLSKEFKSGANIYTLTSDQIQVAGNSLPLSTTQTTVVPVGVKIKSAGDYTFSIPEGTDGIGVTLVDNETGVRTLLSALDYTVNLAAGDYTERFWLEISPIYNTPTGIEEPTSDSSLKGRAQKRIIDGVLYIVKDGKIFDARGTRVE